VAASFYSLQQGNGLSFVCDESPNFLVYKHAIDIRSIPSSLCLKYVYHPPEAISRTEEEGSEVRFVTDNQGDLHMLAPIPAATTDNSDLRYDDDDDDEEGEEEGEEKESRPRQRKILTLPSKRTVASEKPVGPSMDSVIGAVVHKAKNKNDDRRSGGYHSDKDDRRRSGRDRRDEEDRERDRERDRQRNRQRDRQRDRGGDGNRRTDRSRSRGGGGGDGYDGRRSPLSSSSSSSSGPLSWSRYEERGRDIFRAEDDHSERRGRSRSRSDNRTDNLSNASFGGGNRKRDRSRSVGPVGPTTFDFASVKKARGQSTPDFNIIKGEFMEAASMHFKYASIFLPKEMDEIAWFASKFAIGQIYAWEKGIKYEFTDNRNRDRNRSRSHSRSRPPPPRRSQSLPRGGR
jgi:hypothetical protein